MATWKQKREMEELKKRDPEKYAKLMAARESAMYAMGSFDNNLEELRSSLKNRDPNVCFSSFLYFVFVFFLSVV